MRQRHAEAATGLALLSPWFVGMAVFVIGPMLWSLALSFYRYDPTVVTQPARWVGAANYTRLFTSDAVFYKSLGVTLRYAVVSVPLQLVLGLFAALLLNAAIRGIGFYRTCLYLPVVLGGVATSLIWASMFNTSQGLLNAGIETLFRWLGEESMATRWLSAGLQYIFGKADAGSLLPGWLTSERGALNSLILMSLWGLGGSMIVNLAGLQAIPRVYYEAATIDGANALTRFRRITLPLLTPTIFFNLVMGIIGSFQTFTQAYVMTEGGPNSATRFYVMYTYENAFKFFKMGYASALAWVLFTIILLLTLLVVRSASQWVYYEAQRK